ncbi:MAG: hypothetical protein JWO82_1398 [Akkermansiaceae bacterium]|nr:hypothetical protein [Akkermansiaceae bacterium]
MNQPTPDEEIEKLLGRLTPAPPDDALMKRLKAANPDRSNIIPMLRWTGIAAAAVVALTAVMLMRPAAKKEMAKGEDAPPGPATTLPVKVPVESRQHLMEVKDLGIVQDTSGQQQPVRLIRTTWVDEIFYETEPGSAPVKEARVRQEVLPVALNSY